MGGIIGRLFREFAVTLTMAIFVSLIVSLTLTPMMASRFLRAPRRDPARPLLSMERARLRCAAHVPMSAASISRCAGAGPRFSSSSPRSACRSICSSSSQGLLPAAGHRPDHRGTSEAAQDISFADMKRRQEALGADRAGRPRCRQRRDGDRRQRRRAQHRPHVHHAEAARASASASAQQIIARLRPKLEKVRRRPAVHAGGAGRPARRPADPHPVRISRCRTPISPS